MTVYILHIQYPPARKDMTLHMERKLVELDIKKGSPALLSYRLNIEEGGALVAVQEFTDAMEFVCEYKIEKPKT